MDVLLAVPSLRVGGAERGVAGIANHWARQGRRVGILTRSDNGAAFSVAPEVERYSLGLSSEIDGRLQLLAGVGRFVSRTRRILAATQPAVCITFLPSINAQVFLASRGLGIPVIVSERSDPRHAPATMRRQLARRVIYAKSAGVVVQTRSLHDWIRSRSSQPSVHVVPNFVSPAVLHRLDRLREAGVGEAKPHRLLAMGRLHPAKGFDLLVRAFSRVSAGHPDWVLRIHGEGPERPALEQLVRTLGLEDKVELPGTTNAAHAMAEASAFVLSSRYEGFSNVLIEAMAAGLPVVSFDCPSGPGEILRHDINGLLVPAGDMDRLAAAIDRLMTDSSLRERLGARAVAIRERLAVDGIMALWDDVVRQALNGHRAS